MNAVKNDIETLVQKELKSANEHFPPFNSAHEGYAVLLEEIEELKENVSEIKQNVHAIWQVIRQNDVCEERMDPLINRIEISAVNAAVEAIQVAAMCEKFKALLRWDENE